MTTPTDTPTYDALAAARPAAVTALAAVPLPREPRALAAVLTSRRRGPRRARKGKA